MFAIGEVGSGSSRVAEMASARQGHGTPRTQPEARTWRLPAGGPVRARPAVPPLPKFKSGLRIERNETCSGKLRLKAEREGALRPLGFSIRL